VTKKVREKEKEPVLEFLEGTNGHHRKINFVFKGKTS